MQGHEEFEEEIPAYVAGRLEGAGFQRLEAHLRECIACADFAETAKAIAAALREAGDDVLTPHPEASVLREHALGQLPDADGALTRHIGECPSCALEAGVWRAREAGTSAPVQTRGHATAAPRRRRLLPASLGLVAGVILGVALTQLLGPAPRPVIVPSSPTPPASSAPPQDLAPVRAPWTGPVQFFLLPRPLRGQAAAPTFKVDPGQPLVLIAVQPDLPRAVRSAGPYHFAIRDAVGAEAWSGDLDADEVRRRMLAAGVVVFALMSRSLPPGNYEMTVAPPLTSIKSAGLTIPFTIEH